MLDSFTYPISEEYSYEIDKFQIDKETITIPKGSYEIDDIKNIIIEKIKEKQAEAKKKVQAAIIFKQEATNLLSKEDDIEDKYLFQ